MKVAQPVMFGYVAFLLAASPAPAQTAGRSPDRPLQISVPSTNPFLGGVPSGAASPETISITIVDAMRRALEHNLGVILAEDQVGRSDGIRRQTLADLMPDIRARVNEARQTINLAAFGFGTFSTSFGDVPPIVGPFNVFDARVYIRQSLLDLGAKNSLRKDEHNQAADRLLSQGARDFVVHVAGTLYLQALAADARATSVRSQQQTADALYRQAVDLKTGGLIAGLDVLRAQVELSSATQRATATSNEAEKARLQLARVMGLPLGQKFALDANLPTLPQPDVALDQALESAYKTRADYQAALERVKAAEAAVAAVNGDKMPLISVNGDYGAIGVSAADARGTFTVAANVSIPIWEGGKIQGRLLEAEGDLKHRRAEAEDLKAQIYYDIRTAFLDLQATSEQLEVARRGRELAAQQLTQSRDRFGAGVTSNIEIVQAQEAVAIAEEQFIAAEYGVAFAKGALLRGVGTAEETILQILGGAR